MPSRGGSIRDVAKATGLSIATVSRVVNDTGKVSDATRNRVLEACELLDYLPNPAARALATSRSRTIAAIIPTIEHSVFAKYIAAIEMTLAGKGYSLVLSISNGDPDEEYRAARKLLGMGADAFILSGADHDPRLIDLLTRRVVPFVFTSIWTEGGQFPTIGYDNAELARQACTHLAAKGHQRVAVLHGPLAASDRTAARRAGAEAAQSDEFQPVFIETDLNVAGGKSAVRQLLTTDAKASAILCFSDVIALGASFGLTEAGLSVPEDYSLMGFDNLDWSSEIEPALTTIDIPAADMGVRVATSLVQHLVEGTALESLQLAADIVERGSVRDLNA